MSQPLPPSFGLPERVYVENEWYDGPRSGIANLSGQPHRFFSRSDEAEDEYTGTFLLWPVAEAELALEQEQWAIFVRWNERYEAGAVDSASHPGHAGANSRWDEIEAQLSSPRKSVPATAKLAKVQVVPLNQGTRYALSGPSYQLASALI
jgi:hypothetical protein